MSNAQKFDIDAFLYGDNSGQDTANAQPKTPTQPKNDFDINRFLFGENVDHKALDPAGIGEKYAQDFNQQESAYADYRQLFNQRHQAVQQYRLEMDNYFAQKGYLPEQRAQILAEFDAKVNVLNPTDNSVSSYITDPWNTLGKGFMQFGDNVVSAFAPDSTLAKEFREAAQAYDVNRTHDSQLKSRQTQLDIDKDINNGTNEALATFKHLVTNPSQIGNFALENLPQMMLAPAGAVVMGATGSAQGVGAYRKAIMEAWNELPAEEAMKKPEIQERLDQGMTLDQAIEDVATDISDHIGGILGGAAIGSLESLSPLGKIGNVGKAANSGVLKTFGKEVAKEGVQEGLEQFNENLGVGYIDGKTKPMDNVQRSMVTGALTNAPYATIGAYDAYRNGKVEQINGTQSEQSLNTDEQEIQQASSFDDEQIAQPQPQQAVEIPQNNANAELDQDALEYALANINNDDRELFQQRLARDIASGKAESRNGKGKYDKFVQAYLKEANTPVVAKSQSLFGEKNTQGEVAPEIRQPNTVIQGGQAQIQLGSQGSQTAQYELVEADELTVNLKPNAYQDRDRTSVESQAQIMDYANNLNPSYLGASVDVTQGAPTVDEQYGVFAGNGRLSAIKQAYAKNPEKATAYRDYLAQNAGQFGLTAEQVAGMKQPVLVRKMTSPIDVRKAVKEGNFNTGLDKGVLGNAKDNAQYITDDLLDLALINEDGSLNLSSSNDDFIQGLVANIPVEIRPKFFAERKMGNHSAYTLTAQGRELVENALLVRAYSDGTSYAENLLTDLITDISDSNKRVKTALISVAGKVIQTKGTDYDIAPSIIQAYDLMTKGKKAGLDVQEAINQGDMLNPPSEFVKGLVERFYSPKSVVEVQQPLNEYLNKVINSNLNNTQQNNMFGDDFNPSREQLLRESGMKASLARNNATVDSDIEQARTIIEQRLGKEYADRIEFKRSSDFSANDGRSQSEGFFENGKVRLVVDNIQNTPVMNRTERMAWVAWHEFAHNGVALKYGTQYDRVMLYARSNAFIRRLTKIKQAEYRNEGVILTENLATEESLVELYAAIKTGNWDEIADRYGVHVSQEWKTGEKKTGLEKIIDVVARSLRLIASKITGKDLRKASIDDVLGMLKQVDNAVNSLAENSENQTASNDARYSLNERADSEFAKAVEAIENGDNPASAKITLGTTPDVLKMLGIDDGNVIITARTLRKDMVGKHKVSPEAMKQLPQQLNDPIAVVHSRPDSTNPEAYLMLTELTEVENGKELPVIAALDFVKNKDGDFELVEIASAYGRKNVKVAKDLLYKPYYWNKAKGNHFLKNFSLSSENSELISELRTSFSSDDYLSARNVKTEADLSQYQAENSGTRYSRQPQDLSETAYNQAKANGKTELTFQQWKQVRSPEFKRWFGDWENDPENASKVINPKTGEPLVAYHGTPNKGFTVFDIERLNAGKNFGKGVYLTANNEIAKKYATGKNADVMNLYVSIKRPFELNGNLDDAIIKQIAGNARNYNSLLKQRGYNKTQNAKQISIGNMTATQSEQIKAEAQRKLLLDYEYDGIVVPRRGIIIAFESNQIKSATDNNGEFSAENEDIRYSRRAKKTDEPYQRDLIVTHNITWNGILHADEVGGLPYMSLAIAKQDNPVTGFGEVTLIGTKEDIDPQGKHKARVFGGDIYSKRYKANGDSRNLSEIAQEMKAEGMELRNSENYEKGSFRAKAIPEFYSLDEVKQNKERLKKNVENHKADRVLNEKMINFARDNHTSFIKVKSLVADMAYYDVNASMDVADLLFEQHGIQDTDQNRNAMQDILEHITNMPVEYFEAKSRDITQFSDFIGAVVPTDVNERAREVLEKAGLKLYEYDRNNPNSRAEVIKQATTELDESSGGNILFSRAARRPKSESLEKLRKAKTIRITGTEIEPSEDLRQYKRNALEYGKSLRGTYVNKDTGRKIELGAGGVKEVLQHDYKNPDHLQSIAAIPLIIEQATYIDTLPNEETDKNFAIDEYEYYVAGLNIGGTDYTVKAVVGVSKDGDRYYDHKLSEIEKGDLLSLPSRITNPVGENNSPLSAIDDKRLLQILQDENAENTLRYSRKRSALDIANAKKVRNHDDTFWQHLRKGDWAALKKDLGGFSAKLDEWITDSNRPVIDWVMAMKKVSPKVKATIIGRMQRATGLRDAVVSDLESRYLKPIQQDLAKLANEYFDGDVETTMNKVGFWISARWAVEKNAQLLAREAQAMNEAEQAYNDAIANKEPSNVLDRLERAFIKAENQYYNRKADVESRDFSNERKYKVGVAGGWSSPLAQEIM